MITGIDDAVNLTIADYISQFYFSCRQVVYEMDEEADETCANLTDMLEKRMARKKQQIIDVAVKTARDMLTAETATASSMFVASLPSSNLRDMLKRSNELRAVAPAAGIDLLLRGAGVSASGGGTGGALAAAMGGAAGGDVEGDGSEGGEVDGGGSKGGGSEGAAGDATTPMQE